MKIFIIHNSQDKLRAENIKTQFASQEGNWQYEIVEAVMDYDMPRRGISKSHKKCVQMAKDQKLDSITIAEDDLKLLSPWSLNLYQNSFDGPIKDWDLVFGGIYSGDVIENNDSLWVKVINKVSGLHLYTVNNKFYDKFLSADENYNIDYFLSEELKAKMYCIYPFVAIQNDGYSYNVKEITKYNETLQYKYKLINGN